LTIPAITTSTGYPFALSLSKGFDQLSPNGFLIIDFNLVFRGCASSGQ